MKLIAYLLTLLTLINGCDFSGNQHAEVHSFVRPDTLSNLLDEFNCDNLKFIENTETIKVKVVVKYKELNENSPYKLHQISFKNNVLELSGKPDVGQIISFITSTGKPIVLENVFFGFEDTLNWIRGTINYEESTFYKVGTEEELLLIESTPLNWTGKSVNNRFYQLIDMKNNLVFNFMAVCFDIVFKNYEQVKLITLEYSLSDGISKLIYTYQYR